MHRPETDSRDKMVSEREGLAVLMEERKEGH